MDDGIQQRGRVHQPGTHVAEAEVRLGSFAATSRLSITTEGLVAVAGLVGVVLVGTAGIVWAATGPARRRAEHGVSRK